MSNELATEILNEAWRELVPPPSLWPPAGFVLMKRTDEIYMPLPENLVWWKMVPKALDVRT